ncbi:MAG: segregation/condensation protein A [Planctomycetes bacterium]|nr:segregation/condensation protein A [Planctomycetota bacterium]
MADIAEYKLQIENFYGPLDLLLHLVREEEVPILEIPIARIAEQYIGYLELMRKLDINLAGEFLVMAATLMVIKARTLVPAEALEEEEEDDPRLELVRRLLEYKRFKDRARELARLYDDQSRRCPRPYLPEPEKEAPAEGSEAGGAEESPPAPLEIWDLVRNYAKITKETNLAVPTEILFDVIPIEEIMAQLLRFLEERKTVLFSEVLGENPKRAKVVGNFLALLELTKQQQIATEQERDFSDIRIRRLEPPPANAEEAGAGSAAAGEAGAADAACAKTEGAPAATEGTPSAAEPTPAAEPTTGDAAVPGAQSDPPPGP